ncbi:MAG: septal ring lytic transglycosylase RlpA family lipoprotein [Legionellales bacterium]|nr:septal ring lytic transglycosylase RlpA family lipoprotein [Legionellales bacterium]
MILILLSCFLLFSCGRIDKVVSPVAVDSAPKKKIDVETIPNAIPKKEPKSRYGNPKSYVVFGKRYYVMDSGKGYIEKGIASWYGTKFHGRRTSSGETYDMYAMTAAHKSLPLPTYVKVTNLSNDKFIVVKVNDRGPFHENRIIDLSYTAAIKLDIIQKGTGLVEVKAIDPEEPKEDNLVKDDKISTQDTSFYIQVGTFSKLESAKILKQKLGSFGDNLIKISNVIVSGNTLYRVRIGPFTDTKLSDSIVSKLSDFGIFEHRIVTN